MDIKYEAGKILQLVLIARAPYRTGNLALNSIRLESDGENTCVLIGGEIAPYAPFTNEPWEIGKTIQRGNFKKGEVVTYERTKPNPNEGWIDKAITEALPLVKAALAGNLSEADINAVKKQYEDIREQRDTDYAEYLKKEGEKI